MCKLKFLLDRRSLEIKYVSFIRPLLEYADVVWDNCTLYALEKVDLEAARKVTRTLHIWKKRVKKISTQAGLRQEMLNEISNALEKIELEAARIVTTILHIHKREERKYQHKLDYAKKC